MANTAVGTPTDSFCHVYDNTFTSVAEATVLQYTQGQIEIQLTLAAGWALLGNLILI